MTSLFLKERVSNFCFLASGSSSLSFLSCPRSSTGDRVSVTVLFLALNSQISFLDVYDFSSTCSSAPGCQTSPRLLPSSRLRPFRFPPSSPDQGQPRGKASQSPSWKYFLQTLASKSSWFMILFSRMTRDSLRHEKTQLWFDILTPDLLHSPLQLTFESKDPVTHVIRLSTSKATICHATNVRHFPPVL